MLNILPILVLTMPVQDVTVTSVEPAAAAAIQMAEARCGAHRLTISRGISGAAADTLPAIRVDGSWASGAAAALARFLAPGVAAYRFAIQCAPGGDQFLLQSYRVSGAPGTQPSYATQIARIAMDGTVTLDAEAQIDADSFWFR